jgi:hypothetical protein
VVDADAGSLRFALIVAGEEFSVVAIVAGGRTSIAGTCGTSIVEPKCKSKFERKKLKLSIANKMHF